MAKQRSHPRSEYDELRGPLTITINHDGVGGYEYPFERAGPPKIWGSSLPGAHFDGVGNGPVSTLLDNTVGAEETGEAIATAGLAIALWGAFSTKSKKKKIGGGVAAIVVGALLYGRWL